MGFYAVLRTTCAHLICPLLFQSRQSLVCAVGRCPIFLPGSADRRPFRRAAGPAPHDYRKGLSEPCHSTQDPSSLAPFNTVLLTPRQDAAAPPPSVVQPAAAGSRDTGSAITVSASDGPPARCSATIVQGKPADGAATGWGPGSSPELPDDFLGLAARYKQQPKACPAGQQDQQAGPRSGTQMRAGVPCVKSFVGALSQCTPSGSPDVCCGFVAGWSQSNCWCMPAGQQLLDSMPTCMTPALLQLLGWVCD